MQAAGGWLGADCVAAGRQGRGVVGGSGSSCPTWSGRPARVAMAPPSPVQVWALVAEYQARP